MYPFSVHGRTIRIHRYKVEYEIEIPHTVILTSEPEEPQENEDLESDFFPVVKYYNNRIMAEAEASEHEGATLTELDSSAYEWMDGIEVADVPDTYAEAVKIYEMGQAAYEAELAKPTPEEQTAALEQQVTDLQMALCEMYEAMEVMRS